MPAAFFLQDLRGGGAERSVVRLVNGMVERGIPVHLVLINRTGSYLDELDKRVAIHELPQKRTLSSILGFRAYLNEHRPQVVFSTMTHVNIAAIVARMISKHRPRLVTVEHNQITSNLKLKSGAVKLGYALVPYLYPLADAVGAVSEGVRRDIGAFARLPLDKIHVLPNPVVSPELMSLADDPADHDWFTGKNVPVILAVGRLTSQKNFPMLIEAFALLRRRMNARLVILGEGELKPELEALIEKKGLQGDVDLPGFALNPFAYMAKADVFALSSDWEGLPTVLIEAMACGVPVVATNCKSGPDEILEGGRYGHLVPVGDAVAFADALETALVTTKDSQAAVARANHFNLDNAVNRYIEVAALG